MENEEWRDNPEGQGAGRDGNKVYRENYYNRDDREPYGRPSGERMQRHTDHARVIAEYLAAHPLVPQTCYPGLKSHPDHDVAARTLMHGFGPAVDFELAERMSAGTFIKRCSASHRDHPAGGRATRLSPLCGDESHYIRLFAGLDDPIDIVDSLEQAMRDVDTHTLYPLARQRELLSSDGELHRWLEDVIAFHERTGELSRGQTGKLRDTPLVRATFLPADLPKGE